jgi:hypothetical protein
MANPKQKFQDSRLPSARQTKQPTRRVAILIKNDILAILESIQSYQLEMLGVRQLHVMPNGSDLGIATYYNPPLDKQEISNFFTTHPQAILVGVGDLKAKNRM